MNKNDLVAHVAESTGLTKAHSAEAIDAFVQAVTQALRRGDEVRLVGFGTFCVMSRKATEGRNPKTGEKIKIPAAKIPKFKPGQTLKNSIA